MSAHKQALSEGEQLKQLGLKVTPLRIALLGYLLQSELPIDVASCSEYLTTQRVVFDRVTLYRNLETFVQKGLAKKIDLHNGRYYYEKDDACSHLICQKCGVVEHVHLSEPAVAIQKIKKKTGFLVQQQVRDFFGVCEACQK